MTKLDLERIKQLADIFEATVNELINSSELKIRFEEPKIIGANRHEVYNRSNYPVDLEVCHLLLKEKDNEIVFLRELLNKLSSGKK